MFENVDILLKQQLNRTRTGVSSATLESKPVKMQNKERRVEKH